MIPKYPEFTRLSVAHKDQIVRFTSNFDPYSDFNFTSLLCWDITETTSVSDLNGNLVIKLPDYVTTKTLVSILGKTKIKETVKTLISDCEVLELVPEVVVKQLNTNDYELTEDRDQFDYVYDLEAQVQLNGKKHKNTRNKINSFLRNYEERIDIRKINFSDKEKCRKILDIFDDWAEDKLKAGYAVTNEKIAAKRLLKYATKLNLIGLQISMDGKTIGFSINEFLENDYAICHFQKSILKIPHIDTFLSNIVSKELKHFGCKYINWEQDLGIDGLRKSKSSYYQEFFLKKYRVKKS